MNFSIERSRKAFRSRCSNIIHDRDVQQGIGAVLVLIGITLFVSGVIFTIVAYTGPKKDSVGSFPYVGPIVTIFAVLFVTSGYGLSHMDDFKQAWSYFKRRKGQLYVTEQDSITSEEDLNGSVSAICCRFLVCIFVRRNVQRSPDTIDTATDASAATSTDVEQTHVRAGLNTFNLTTSFSSLGQCKVHPHLTDSSDV